MIDIHTHILPNIDDGASSYEEAIKMLSIEVQNDVDVICLTPHYFVDNSFLETKERIDKSYEDFVKKVDLSNIQFVLGYEVYYNNKLFSQLKNGLRPTLGNSDYILIEFSLIDRYYDIQEVLYNIASLGFKPILAHPERYLYLSIDDIEDIVSDGVLIQINTSSILGDFGNVIKNRCKELLKRGLVDFIASDAHDSINRKPNLKETIKFVKDKYKIDFENENIKL